jgi:hypothetical protein
MSTFIYPQTPSSSGGATSANQTTEIGLLTALNNRIAGSLAPVTFDTYTITYVGATTDISTVVYKLGATTVRTLVLSYDGSNRLTGVVAS